MKRVSIKDVAKEAGVSATTVSYVLNRTPSETISSETTQRVLEAARKLDAAALEENRRAVVQAVEQIVANMGGT